MNRSNKLINDSVLVKYFKANTTTNKGDLCWHKELLIPKTFAPFLNHLNFRFQFSCFIFQFNVCISFWFSYYSSIHRHNFLPSKESELKLVILWLDLGRLDNILNFRVRVVLNSNLLVPFSANCNTNL